MDAFFGEIRIFPFTFSPRGWAYCNGQTMSIQQNAALAAILSTTYGGDGQSTFALPNLQGVVPIGTGTGAGLTARQAGKFYGADSVTLTPTQLPSHNHTFNAAIPQVAVANTAGGRTSAPATQGNLSFLSNFLNNASPPKAVRSFVPAAAGPAPTPNLAPLATASLGSTGSATLAPHDNLQPYVGMNYFICVDGFFPTRS